MKIVKIHEDDRYFLNFLSPLAKIWHFEWPKKHSDGFGELCDVGFCLKASFSKRFLELIVQRFCVDLVSLKGRYSTGFNELNGQRFDVDIRRTNMLKRPRYMAKLAFNFVSSRSFIFDSR